MRNTANGTVDLSVSFFLIRGLEDVLRGLANVDGIGESTALQFVALLLWRGVDGAALITPSNLITLPNVMIERTPDEEQKAA